MTEAIGHALAAGDTAWAVRLAEEHVETAVLRSEVAAVRHWLALLPGDVVRPRPRLCVAAAVVALVGHDLEAVEPWLRDAERGLGTGDRDEAPPDPSAPAEDGPSQGAGTLADELFADLPLAIVVIRGTLARLRGDAARAIACAQRALDHLPDTEYLRGVAAWDLGLAYWMGGDLAAADRVLGALSARATPTGSVETLYAPLLGSTTRGRSRSPRAGSTPRRRRIGGRSASAPRRAGHAYRRRAGRRWGWANCCASGTIWMGRRATCARAWTWAPGSGTRRPLPRATSRWRGSGRRAATPPARWMRSKWRAGSRPART